MDPIIYAISDIHGYLPSIPPCDILLMAGDYNPYRALADQIQWMNGPFKEWFHSLPARHIVWIGGNHDFALQNRSAGFLEPFKGNQGNITTCKIPAWN